jgi:hypothetical protein
MIRLSGKNIKVPFQNVHIPVTVGNIVTFTSVTRDSSSRNTVSILHVRHDIDWFNNTNHISFEKSIYFLLNLNLTDFTKDFANHKLFFENYAKDNGFDPLVPENWYFQTVKNIIAIKVLNTTQYTMHTMHYATHTILNTTYTYTMHTTQHTLYSSCLVQQYGQHNTVQSSTAFSTPLEE